MKQAAIFMVLLALAAPALAQQGYEQPRGKEAVVEFLALAGDQVVAWDRLIEARQAAVEPLREQLRAVLKQVRDLLAEQDPDAVAVGSLTIQAKQLRTEIEAANTEYVKGFEALLTREQMAKLIAIRRAARVAPLIPVFERFGLVARDNHRL